MAPCNSGSSRTADIYSWTAVAFFFLLISLSKPLLILSSSRLMWLPWGPFLFLTELTERGPPPIKPELLPTSLASLRRLGPGPCLSSIWRIWACWTSFLFWRAFLSSACCLLRSLSSMPMTILMYSALFCISRCLNFCFSCIYLSNSFLISTFRYRETSRLRFSATSAFLSFRSYSSRVLRSCALSAWSVFL